MKISKIDIKLDAHSLGEVLSSCRTLSVACFLHTGANQLKLLVLDLINNETVNLQTLEEKKKKLTLVKVGSTLDQEKLHLT